MALPSKDFNTHVKMSRYQRHTKGANNCVDRKELAMMLHERETEKDERNISLLMSGRCHD